MDVVTAKMKSPLADKMVADGAVLGEYCGVETASRFGGVDTEFAAMITSCGVYDLGWRGKISVTGNDRARWLNGMVTNNVKDLALNHGNYNFLLNAQGRIQGDMYVYNCGERLLIDTERSQVEHLVKTLDHFIIMDDVELSDVGDQITSIGVQGPKAKGVLKSCGIEPAADNSLVVCDMKWNGNDISVTRMANGDYSGYEIWLASAVASALWEALRKAGTTPVGTEALERFRVVAGVPRYGVDIRDRDLPQETGQSQALNFTKGCYIGQEIVERIRSRGNVHRMFTGFETDSDVAAASKVVDASGKEVGEITSVASANGRHIALGYVRREAENGPLSTNGVPVKTTRLPFKLS